MQMTHRELAETGFPRKAGLDIVPLPLGQSTMRRPDGKVAQTAYALHIAGRRSLTWCAYAVAHGRRGAP